ncbi:hypothetical protein BB561_003061 [Smittium simulii]|uniref:Adenylate cyclase n=1 Tax=Smittium simulii TaxID=133385 RepID=A0A2T9YNA1_9FUNG|nr:hypothetical protein BB561_003061 [Smittium simulii]
MYSISDTVDNTTNPPIVVRENQKIQNRIKLFNFFRKKNHKPNSSKKTTDSNHSSESQNSQSNIKSNKNLNKILRKPNLPRKSITPKLPPKNTPRKASALVYENVKVDLDFSDISNIVDLNKVSNDKTLLHIKSPPNSTLEPNSYNKNFELKNSISSNVSGKSPTRVIFDKNQFTLDQKKIPNRSATISSSNPSRKSVYKNNLPLSRSVSAKSNRSVINSYKNNDSKSIAHRDNLNINNGISNFQQSPLQNYQESGECNQIEWPAPESWVVLPNNYRKKSSLAGSFIRGYSSSSEIITEDIIIDDGRQYFLRIYKEDSSFGTFNCKLTTSAADILAMAGRKFFISDISLHCLCLTIANGLSRILKSNEKPAHIFKKTLLSVGYYPQDNIPKRGGEDTSYLFKLTLIKAGITTVSLNYTNILSDPKNINLEAKRLQTIPVPIYTNARLITYLNVAKNPEINLPSDFLQDCTILTDLDLSYCEFSTVPNSLQYLPRLSKINLSNNNLTSLAKVLTKFLIKLNELILKNNSISSLSSDFSRLSRLTVLDLSNNKFKTFPSVLTKIESLTIINLSFNFITSIPESIMYLKNLRIFNMTGNLLKGSLPKGMSHLINLDKVYFELNEITDFEPLANLPNLRKAYLGNNSSKTVEWKSPKIKFIYFSFNKITKFQLGASLQFLSKIDLCSNKLTELPKDVFSSVPRLERLKLDNNLLVALPKCISNLSLLWYLSVTNNLLSSLPKELVNLSSLKHLSAQKNKLKSIFPEIWLMPKLEYINLSSNLIEHFPSPTKFLNSTTFQPSSQSIRSAALAFSSVAQQVKMHKTNKEMKPSALKFSSNRLSDSISSYPNEQNTMDQNVLSKDIKATTSLNKPSRANDYSQPASSDIIGYASSTSLHTITDAVTSKANFANNSQKELKNAIHTKARLSSSCSSEISNKDSLYKKFDSNPNFAKTIGNVSLSNISSKRSSCLVLEDRASIDTQNSSRESLGYKSDNTKNFSPDNNFENPIIVKDKPDKNKADPIAPKRNLPPLSYSLKELNIANNGLEDDFLFLITFLENLTILNVSYNSLFEIPAAAMAGMGKLTELYLSATNISTIPEEDSNNRFWRQMRVLFLNCNRLQSLPSWFAKLSNLTYLNFSHNARLEIVGQRFVGHKLHDNALPDNNAANANNQENRINKYVLGPYTISKDVQEPSPDMSDFFRLKNLKMLGLMGLTVMIPLPEDTALKRVRMTDLFKSIGYGVADSLGNNPFSVTRDMVHSKTFSTHREMLFGVFSTCNCPNVFGAVMTRFVSDSFNSIFRKELNKLDQIYRNKGKANKNDLNSTNTSDHNLVYNNPNHKNSNSSNLETDIDPNSDQSKTKTFFSFDKPSQLITDALRLTFLEINKALGSQMPSWLFSSNLYNRKNNTNQVSVVDPQLSNVRSGNQLNQKLSLDNPLIDNFDFEELKNLDMFTGVTGVVAFIQRQSLYIANVGDSIGILSRRGTPIVMSGNHQISDPEEISRIQRLSGDVLPRGSALSDKNITRGIGCFGSLPYINSEPTVISIQICKDDEFFILGNSALWEYVSYDQAIQTVRNSRRTPSELAAQLRDFAIAYGSKEAIMVMVITLGSAFESSLKKISLSHAVRESILGIRPQNKLSGINEIRIDNTPDSKAFKKNRNIAFGHYSVDLDALEDSIINANSYNAPESNKERRQRLKFGDNSKSSTFGGEVEPPVGEVALVFTDVKNSTAQWDANPAAMREAIIIHNKVMRRLLRIFGGYEVKTEGDAFMVSFSSATKALGWCLAVQLVFLKIEWPSEVLDSEDGKPVYLSYEEYKLLEDSYNNLVDSTEKPNLQSEFEKMLNFDNKIEASELFPKLIYRGLRIRMGIHLGTPVCEEDPITGRMDYFGPMVNRSSRVSGAADGGQIYISHEVTEEVNALTELFAIAHDQKITDMSKLISDPILAKDVQMLWNFGMEYRIVGERKLKGLETPETLSIVYPNSLKGRFIYNEDILKPQKKLGVGMSNSGVSEKDGIGLLPLVQSISPSASPGNSVNQKSNTPQFLPKLEKKLSDSFLPQEPLFRSVTHSGYTKKQYMSQTLNGNANISSPIIKPITKMKKPEFLTAVKPPTPKKEKLLVKTSPGIIQSNTGLKINSSGHRSFSTTDAHYLYESRSADISNLHTGFDIMYKIPSNKIRRNNSLIPAHSIKSFKSISTNSLEINKLLGKPNSSNTNDKVDDLDSASIIIKSNESGVSPLLQIDHQKKNFIDYNVSPLLLSEYKSKSSHLSLIEYKSSSSNTSTKSIPLSKTPKFSEYDVGKTKIDSNIQNIAFPNLNDSPQTANSYFNSKNLSLNQQNNFATLDKFKNYDINSNSSKKLFDSNLDLLCQDDIIPVKNISENEVYGSSQNSPLVFGQNSVLVSNSLYSRENTALQIFEPNRGSIVLGSGLQNLKLNKYRKEIGYQTAENICVGSLAKTVLNNITFPSDKVSLLNKISNLVLVFDNKNKDSNIVLLPGLYDQANFMKIIPPVENDDKNQQDQKVEDQKNESSNSYNDINQFQSYNQEGNQNQISNKDLKECLEYMNILANRCEHLASHALRCKLHDNQDNLKFGSFLDKFLLCSNFNPDLYTQLPKLFFSLTENNENNVYEHTNEHTVLFVSLVNRIDATDDLPLPSAKRTRFEYSIAASPMLFGIYINDIFNGVTDVSVPGMKDRITGLLFSDDL